MHKITNQIGLQSSDIIIKEKTLLSHAVVCFQMLDFETPQSNSDVLKSNSWKITSFLKTTSLKREPFLTMFYILSTSHDFDFQVRFYANNYFE